MPLQRPTAANRGQPRPSPLRVVAKPTRASRHAMSLDSGRTGGRSRYRIAGIRYQSRSRTSVTSRSRVFNRPHEGRGHEGTRAGSTNVLVEAFSASLARPREEREPARNSYRDSYHDGHQRTGPLGTSSSIPLPALLRANPFGARHGRRPARSIVAGVVWMSPGWSWRLVEPGSPLWPRGLRPRRSGRDGPPTGLSQA